MADRWYFDGGCRPNPGAMEVAVVHGGETFVRTDLGIGDSSEAEWRALLFAVERALGAGAKDVTFIGDNAMVVAQARGEAACRPRLKVLLDSFREATADFDRVQVRHVARAKNPAGTALTRRAR